MSTRVLSLAGVTAAVFMGWSTPPNAEVGRSDDTPLVGISMPNKEAIVAPEQAGKIVSLPFVAGDTVRKDQEIFRLNSRLEELEVERLRPIVESDLARQRALANLEHAQRQEKRLHDLRDQNIASDADLQEQVHEVALARLRLRQAELEMGQARNQLAQAQEKLEQRSVKSPFDGIVTQRFKSEGESVERFAGVIEVMSLHPLWVEFDCPVQDKDKFQVGNRIAVAQAFSPLDTREGVILHKSPKSNASSHTFVIRAQVPNKDLSWHTGQKMLVSKPATTEGPAAKPGK